MSILVLTSDTLSSPAAAGQIEYSSPIFTGTPIGTQRGIVPTQQYYRLNADLAGTNVSTAQSLFGVGVTLSASTVYEFEIVGVLTKTAGTTAHTIGFGFGGTATINNVLTEIRTWASSTASTPSNNANIYEGYATSVSSTASTPSFSSATIFLTFVIKGTVSVNAGGTFIPQYTLSAAPGGAYSTAAGSYIRINPLSASGAATNVGTWA
jgi:hypothetical protein